MQWLCRIFTQPGGLVLDPFAGSGTTIEAAIREGLSAIAIERENAYIPLILARAARPKEPMQAMRLASEDLGLFTFLPDA